MSATYWFILGVILLIGEIFTNDFSLACFGIACFISGISSSLGLNVYWQLGIGATAIFVLLFAIRPIFLKYLNKGAEHVKTNVDAIIGRKAKIFEVKPEDAKKGTVKIDGDLWNVHCDEPLKQGDAVVVMKLEGVTLTVKKGE